MVFGSYAETTLEIKCYHANMLLNVRHFGHRSIVDYSWLTKGLNIQYI